MALLVVYGAVPLACVERAIALDIGNSRLATDPAAFEDHAIEMGKAYVEEVEPDWVTVEKALQMFSVEWSGQPAVSVGDYVSLHGVYRNGAIYPTEQSFIHHRGFKKSVSLLGALLLLVVWAPSLWE